MTTRRPTRSDFDDPTAPTWFKVWFAIVAVFALGFLGLIAWAIFEIVTKVTR